MNTEIKGSETEKKAADVGKKDERKQGSRKTGTKRLMISEY